MTDTPIERRAFTRVAIDLPVEVQQGGSSWRQRLIDISLGGAATDQPDVWDAQYNEPFTLLIDTGAAEPLELFAYLQHVENGRLGFKVDHVDRENIDLLRRLLAAHLSNPDVLDGELRRLDEESDVEDD
ncbi:MAG TPA: PilZ domain-containing protein [Haliea salexigens]|uniref:PilZ domain-containing protein n=1 Tax=Haliea salexigens TaxID=287487 RepID=A0A3C1KNX3_9GAMM|nr:PilZ domain-containing protein [Haliea sp.]HAN28377.1 PilZ domain-containing protein [Haliea salexigens]|tara:strand:+ start:1720 stop:2106 length:387 start_codon:yes stop_codon:yes gene_type:complete